LELVGRSDERARIEQVLDAARSGLSAALVFEGVAGIGKSALLELATELAPDFRTLRISGLESEQALGFAGLHLLLGPVLGAVDDLPEPQATALKLAFGLADGPPPDRLRVGLAALSLLAAAAEARPLLCIIDDAHWLDEESALAIGFVARRLFADRVGMLIALRTGEEAISSFDGLERCAVTGLGSADAGAIFRGAREGETDPQVVARAVSGTEGNPLALVELGQQLTPAQRAGTALLPEPLPVGPHLEASFLRQVRALPDDAQLYLLLTAAESSDIALVEAAAQVLGLEARAASAVESSGLVTLWPTIRFRHPLVRSAVYYGAAGTDLRRVHHALALASSAPESSHRRAWHRAAGSDGPDAEIAAELEEAATRASRRGGDLSASVFLTRAAELTPDAGESAVRLLKAAEADLMSGAPARALRKLDEVVPRLATDADRARALRLRGQCHFALGETSVALPILVDAAGALAANDTVLARDTLLDALSVGVFTGRHTSGGLFDTIAAQAAQIPPSDPPTAGDLLLDSLAALYAEGHAAAAPALRAALAALDTAPLRVDQELRWLGFGCLAAGSLADFDGVLRFARRMVSSAREHDALVALTRGLYFLALGELVRGDLSAANAAFEEGHEMRLARGDRSGLGGVLVLAWRGDDAAAREEAESVLRGATDRTQAGIAVYAEYGLAVLELGRGNYSAALTHAREVDVEDSYFLSALALPDLVEAATRSEDLETARGACERLRGRAARDGTDFARGVLALSEALIADPEDAEARYRDAVVHLTASGATGHLARAHLLFGEWLRRRRRHGDAREHLRTATQQFERIGAGHFAERARAELEAAGESTRRRQVTDLGELTPQEAKIARLAAAGATNGEIGHQLFISANTVDYHLRKVFRKLGLESRRQLPAVVFAGSGAP
jgi:DNA-binding CsgD family transcriptional regulator